MRYRVIGVIVRAVIVVLLLCGRRAVSPIKGLLLRVLRRLRRLTPVARVCDSVERHPLHRPVDYGHQMLERGAQLLKITSQHSYGVRGQAAPEPGSRTHPVQRQPGTGDVQQQVRFCRRCTAATGRVKTRLDQVS